MIAIIPARGGSKGLPGKNIKLLNGKPLIAYTIEAALKSDYTSHVIVTTDSKEIADIAKEYGAEVPFIRPGELSDDTSSAVDVYLHTTNFMKNKEVKVEKFIVLLPTAPMRTNMHINEAVELFKSSGAKTLISVKEADIPVTWYLSRADNNRLKNAGFGEGNAINNRQLNQKYFVPNGAIYILDYNLLAKERTYYCDNTVAYEMNAEDSIDIDTLFDFKLAEFLMSERSNS
jgi:CMP-N-acetylneuraminic acid synthetase